ncbi:MAG: hypothetical protein JO311_02360 [Candidatus Eremiobacteraeota bacterium]|nr:hypothetical protein [Candidatus Eremiobacteraeota bacterium]MBV9263876.1 hypothetical protein [Candidatus Eremiobacteraeota bacterium]
MVGSRRARRRRAHATKLKLQPALFVPAAAFAAASLAARAVTRNPPPRWHADFAQPLVVVTNFGVFGAVLLAVLIVALAVAAASYASLLRARDEPSPGALVLASLAALLAAWLMPVLFSSDVYAYAAYGELANRGIDPYLRAPTLPHDALISLAAWQWSNALPPCVYGPAFVGIAQFVVAIFGRFGPHAAIEVVRALGSLALPACAPLAYAAFGGDERAKRIAAATIVANPVTLWCAAEGHNDALALAVGLAGFALVRRGWLSVGALAAALSALIKLPGVFCLAGVAIVQRRARIGCAAGAVLIAALCVPPFLRIATTLAPHGRYAPQASLQGAIDPFAGAVAAVALAAVLSACIVLRGIAELRAGAPSGWICLGIAGWILIPNPYPWYSIWLLALAAIAPRSRAGCAAICLCFASLLRYVPDAVAAPSGVAPVALSVAAVLPLLVLLVPRHARARV